MKVNLTILSCKGPASAWRAVSEEGVFGSGIKTTTSNNNNQKQQSPPPKKKTLWESNCRHNLTAYESQLSKDHQTAQLSQTKARVFYLHINSIFHPSFPFGYPTNQHLFFFNLSPLTTRGKKASTFFLTLQMGSEICLPL